MQTGSGTLIGWKSGQTTYVTLWDRMEGAWLWTPAISPSPIENLTSSIPLSVHQPDQVLWTKK